ncbi:hypothetical protein FS837_012975 [Tulasnella sp. UAMH 9824]|nr:hypothetical protein FS837_012975 [Tulasnella sp. UAMH 9824]
MQLDSVENDLAEVLDYLQYRHDDAETMWHILVDFEKEYTDGAGNTQAVKRTHPTKQAILDALKEAGQTRRSGLVYFGGHGGYELPGASVLKTSGGRTGYMVDVHDPSGPKSSFLLAIDGERIYGDDIMSRLPEKIPTQCVHTVALDACHSSGIASAEGSLLRVYPGEPSGDNQQVETKEDATNPQQRSSKQLVIISAAREGEDAKTVYPGPDAGGKQYGALTWYMLHWLKKYPYATAQNLSERLHQTCAKQANIGEEQHPEIRARYPLTGSFELLPALVPMDDDESREVEIAARGFPIVQTWFRAPQLHSASMRRVPRRRAAAY